MPAASGAARREAGASEGGEASGAGTEALTGEVEASEAVTEVLTEVEASGAEIEALMEEASEAETEVLTEEVAVLVAQV